MPEILLFVEDSAQEAFLTALVRRMATESGAPELRIRVRSAQGGFAKVLGQVEDFVRAQAKGLESSPDALLVAVDANCQGFVQRRKQVEGRTGALKDSFLYAIPDPHIERWFLIDSAAFKTVLGRGCSAPDQKCEKDRYKRLLNQAVLDAGVEPLLGGVEYAEEIVQNMNLLNASKQDDSFGRFLGELRRFLNQCKSVEN